MLDDTKFLALLSDRDLQRQYKKTKKAAIKNAKKSFAKSSGNYKDQFKESITSDRLHREILNASIFPFMQDNSLSTKLGYRFIRAAPLYELQQNGTPLKNMDFLIARSDSPALVLVGEVKASITDHGSAVDETRERILIADSNREYMNKEYIKTQNASYEYILSVSSMDSLETSKAILRKGGHLILWHAERSDEPRLSLAVPNTSNVTLLKTVMHSDNNLNRELKKVRTATNVFTFFQQSHTYSKLLVLTMMRNADGSLLFSKEDLKELVKQTLPYVDNTIIDKETDSIISKAKKIEFVRELDDGRFKIISRHKNADGLEEDLKGRWLEYKLKNKLDEGIREAIEKTQQEFILKRKKMPTLDKF